MREPKMLRKIMILFLGGLLLPPVCSSQTRIDVERQGKGTAFLNPPFASPLRSGASLPATCVVGEIFFLTTAPAGNNIHVCHDEGNWAPQGSAGQANVTVINDGETVGIRPSINFVPGNGTLQVITDLGSYVNIQHSIDTSGLMTRSAGQSGEALRCQSVSASATQYECDMQPTLSAVSTGMVLHWIPDVANAGGGLSLSMDSLGPYAIKLADGATDPRAGDFAPGRMYPLWFDGTVLRVDQAPLLERYQTVDQDQAGTALFCASSGGTGSDYHCSFSEPLFAYSPGMLLRWVPEVSSAGGATTLEIDSLGPKPVKMHDGVSDPQNSELVSGELYLLWYDGTQFRVAERMPRGLLTKSGHQTGQALLCEAENTAGQAFECAMNPGLQAYTSGMVIHFVPDTAVAEGGATLDIDGLGPKAVKAADCATDPGEAVLAAGILYPIWYDGSVFCMQASAGNSTLDGLLNVSTADKSDGDVLAWNATDGKWQPAEPPSGGGTPATPLFGAYSNRPAANTVAPGSIYFSDELQDASDISDGTAWHRIVRQRRVTVPPSISTMTTLNTTAASDIAGTWYLYRNSNGLLFYSAIKAVPGPTWTLDIDITAQATGETGSPFAGIVLADGSSTSNNVMLFGFRGSSGTSNTAAQILTVVKSDSYSGTLTGLYDLPAHFNIGSITRLRAECDATNLIFYFNAGNNWTQFASIAISSHFTPTHYGVGGRVSQFNVSRGHVIVVREFWEH